MMKLYRKIKNEAIMKFLPLKFTLVLFTLFICSTTHAQVTASATASATVVTPIGIQKQLT